jgi:hypothetical protein
MKKTSLSVLILSLLLTALLAGCAGSSSPPRLENSLTALDSQGEEPTAVFGGGDTLYAVTDLENAPDDTTVRAVWTAVEVEGVEPEFQIQETSLTTGTNKIYFELTNPAPWPPGSYRVDLYLNGQLQDSLDFEIR